MKTPNLFDYATSELSQDAFLAWLLANASSAVDTPEDVHLAGIAFLTMLFERCGKVMPSGKIDVEVERQHCHIDVYAVITSDTGRYVLVLEDKAGSGIHGTQLENYKQVVKNEGFDDKHQLLVYCQTHNESTPNELSGFHVVDRERLLPTLKPYQKSNSIIEQFVAHLESLEERTKEWQSVPMKYDGQDNWSWTAWQGFFMSVVKALGDGEWNYVPNPSGGFLGLWWHWREIEGGYAYLQLEQTRACFKIEVGDGSADDLKWIWNTRIIATAAESQLNVTKPTRLRRGTWMTVAVLDCDYRAPREDGTIDFEKTVAALRAMEEIVDKAVESNVQV